MQSFLKDIHSEAFGCTHKRCRQLRRQKHTDTLTHTDGYALEVWLMKMDTEEVSFSK